MLYFGFLAMGLGILLTVAGLICLAIGTFSQEISVAKKAKTFVKRLLPLAFLLLMAGTGVIGLYFGNEL